MKLTKVCVLLGILVFAMLGCKEELETNSIDSKIADLEKALLEKGFIVSKDLYEEEYKIALDNQQYLEILSALNSGNLLLLDRIFLETKLNQGQIVDVNFQTIKKVKQPDETIGIEKYSITKSVSSMSEYFSIQDSLDQSLGIPQNLDDPNAKTELDKNILDFWLKRKSDKGFDDDYSTLLSNNPSLRTMQNGCHDGGTNEDDGTDGGYGWDPPSGGCYSDETFYVPIYAYTDAGARVRQGTYVIHVVRNGSSASVSTSILSNSITPTTTSTSGMGSYAYVSDNGMVHWHVSESFQVGFQNHIQNVYQDGYVEYDGFYTPDGFGYGTKTGDAEGGAYFGNHASTEGD